MNNMSRDDPISHKLGERVKELTAIHQTARLLQDDKLSLNKIIREITSMLSSAWQYPEITEARISFDDIEVKTAKYKQTDWHQSAKFQISSGQKGSIDVCYLENRPQAVEGPFLAEERDLINTLAEMLRAYLQNRIDKEFLQDAHDNLEMKVRKRTEELEKTNIALKQEIEKHRQAEKQIRKYQDQLRRLAAELILAEERQRRELAENLHDHIGQSLAYIRFRFSEFQGNSVFCGFEESLHELVVLLDQTIEYTRSMTFEISPPVLYELGLVPALEWLGEKYTHQFSLPIVIRSSTDEPDLTDQLRTMLFKSVQELIVNAAKHARADRVEIRISTTDDRFVIEVKDNGVGFELKQLSASDGDHIGFGLFSIKERLAHLGGDFDIHSQPGKGSCFKLCIPLVRKNDDD